MNKKSLQNSHYLYVAKINKRFALTGNPFQPDKLINEGDEPTAILAYGIELASIRNNRNYQSQNNINHISDITHLYCKS